MNEIKDLYIEGTAKTPQVDFNHLTGELILYGKSIPENAAKVYEPLVTWINEYIKSPRHITNLRLNLEYFNSASVLWHAKMIKALSKISVEDAVLFINMYFDNDDFEDMDTTELKGIIGSLVDNLGEVRLSIGVKIFGTDDSGKIINESTVLL